MRCNVGWVGLWGWRLPPRRVIGLRFADLMGTVSRRKAGAAALGPGKECPLEGAATRSGEQQPDCFGRPRLRHLRARAALRDRAKA